MSTFFKTLKWCYLNDSDCRKYNIYTPEGYRVTWIHLMGNKNVMGIDLSNGEHDILPITTKMQVELIKR